MQKGKQTNITAKVEYFACMCESFNEAKVEYFLNNYICIDIFTNTAVYGCDWGWVFRILANLVWAPFHPALVSAPAGVGYRLEVDHFRTLNGGDRGLDYSRCCIMASLSPGVSLVLKPCRPRPKQLLVDACVVPSVIVHRFP